MFGITRMISMRGIQVRGILLGSSLSSVSASSSASASALASAGLMVNQTQHHGRWMCSAKNPSGVAVTSVPGMSPVGYSVSGAPVTPPTIKMNMPKGFKPPPGYEKLPLMVMNPEFFDGMDPKDIENPTVEQLQNQVIKYWGERPRLKEMLLEDDDGTEDAAEYDGNDPKILEIVKTPWFKNGMKIIEQRRAEFEQLKADGQVRPVDETDPEFLQQVSADNEAKFGEKLMVPKAQKKELTHDEVLDAIDTSIEMYTGNFSVDATMAQMDSMNLSEEYKTATRKRLESMAKPDKFNAWRMKIARDMYVRKSINGENMDELWKIDWDQYEETLGKAAVKEMKALYEQALAEVDMDEEDLFEADARKILQERLSKAQTREEKEAIEKDIALCEEYVAPEKKAARKAAREEREKEEFMKKVDELLAPAKAETQRLYEQCKQIEVEMEKVQNEIGWLVSNFELMTVDMYIERYPDLAKQLQDDYINDRWDVDEESPALTQQGAQA